MFFLITPDRNYQFCHNLLCQFLHQADFLKLFRIENMMKLDDVDRINLKNSALQPNTHERHPLNTQIHSIAHAAYVCALVLLIHRKTLAALCLCFVHRTNKKRFHFEKPRKGPIIYTTRCRMCTSSTNYTHFYISRYIQYSRRRV